MNLHALTFEQILRVCASLEDPKEIRTMIQALEILEKNLRYRRKELMGVLNGVEIRERREQEKQRKAVKDTLRLIRPNSEDRGQEEDKT